MPKLKLSELKKLEWNPRTIKKEDLDKLTKSIEKFWVIEWRPFLVSNRTGENIIIWGNQRYEVCKKLGITEVPVHIMEWLTEEEEKEIIIRDNISNWEWDWDILANEWDKEELEEWWLDVTFDTVEPEAEEDDFEVDEVVQTDIVLWDLFEIWPHRLLCWDSTNIDDVNKLMNGEKADMVFTDPPYWNWTSGKYGRWRLWVRTIMSDENFDCVNDFFNLRTNNKYVFFLQWRTFKEALQTLENNELKLKTIWVWDKKNAWLNGAWWMSEQWEAIIVAGDIEYTKFWWNVFSVSREQKKREYSPHPHQKPIELLAQILEYFKDYKTLHDPFWWSGSTMVACHQLNRKCYMSELDPKYVQTIVNRMQKLDPSLVIKRNWVPYINSI